MRAARAAGALALTTAAALAAAPQPRLTERSEGRVELLRLDPGGAVVSVCELAGEIWLLVRPVGEADGPRRLLRLTRDPVPRVEERGAAPGWTKTLDAMELGEGVELVVGGLGELASLGPPASAGMAPPRRLIADPDLDPRSLDDAVVRRGPRSVFAVASPGRVREIAARGAALEARFSAPLPLAAELAGGALRLRSPPGQRLELSAGPLYAFGPEAMGRTRLRSTLVDPRRAAAEAVQVAWSRLPSAERAEQSRYLIVDGEPFLAVRTQSSERFDLLEEMRLRVLPLVADRTRAGAAASFATELDTRRWHHLQLAAADGDGDGRDDLVVTRPEGFRGVDLVVASYPGRGGGRFAPHPRRVDLAGPFDAHRFGADGDGDGAPDLVTVGAGELKLWPGVRGRDPVARRPAWRARLGEAPEGSPAAAAAGAARARVDAGVEILGGVALGGDGRSWIGVLVRREAGFDELYLAAPASRRSASIASP